MRRPLVDVPAGVPVEEARLSLPGPWVVAGCEFTVGVSPVAATKPGQQAWLSIVDLATGATPPDGSVAIAGQATYQLQAPPGPCRGEVRLYLQAPGQPLRVLQRLPVEVRQLPPTRLEQVELTVQPGRVAAGGTIEVHFGQPLVARPGTQLWVTVSPAKSPEDVYGDWKFVAAGSESAKLQAPTEGGPHEVRLHADYPAMHYHIVARAPLQVEPQPPRLPVAITLMFRSGGFAPGEPVEVRFVPPLPPAPAGSYWLTITAVGAPDRDFGEYVYLDGGAQSARLAAPVTPGKHELRLHGDYPARSFHVLARATIGVVRSAR
ncbi:MAG: hypothetical protein FJ125_10145 [Deltaproteobacteria bacterium]|nr:hypothetical protein [Deltaproteobacteria bacterium]